MIDKAMQPRRKDRPQSMSEFLNLLGVADAVQPAIQRVVVPEQPVIKEGDEAPEPWPADEETIVDGAPSPSPSPASGTLYSHDYVDLGLSVKWGTCNVGASKPEEYGDLFAWGEIKPKEEYSWLSYRFYEETSFLGAVKLSRYVTKRKNGIIDGRFRLDIADDAANANWGGEWRFPSSEEWNELCEQCEWEWTTLNEVNGYKVTGPNGNSIFLPAAGVKNDANLDNTGSCGYYWSSSLYTDTPVLAHSGFFHSLEEGRSSNFRYQGLSVRPVIE